MRLRFCWDNDCPDWVLDEIFHITKVMPQIIKDVTLQIVEDACGGDELNFDYVADSIISRCNLKPNTIRSLLAAIRWILTNAAGAEAEPNVLSSELQQLGMTKEHSLIMAEVYEFQKERLLNTLKKRMLQASENILFTYELREHTDEDKYSVCQLELQGKILEQENGYFCEAYFIGKKNQEKDKNNTKVLLSPGQLDGIINELEEALQNMELLGK